MKVFSKMFLSSNCACSLLCVPIFAEREADSDDEDDEDILEVDLDDSKQESGEKGPKREIVGESLVCW